MPGKSRRRRGKFSVQSKRKKGRPSRPTVAVQQQAVTQAHEPVPPSNVPASPASVPTPAVKPAAVHYPFIATELRTIGILAAIMLIILAVLALVLS